MKKIFFSFSATVLIVLAVGIVSSASWEYGSLHQHTGYSTWYGYDGDPFTTGDNCLPIQLELHALGYSVAELKEDALDKGLDWLAFSDHSYCANSSEFNTVKNDCQTVQNESFSCLWGEEVSAAEIVPDIESAFGCDPLGINDDGEAHLGAYGIDNYISQSPFAQHCPLTPNVTGAINNVTGQSGISIINHPYSTEIFGQLEFLDFESINAVSGEKGIEIWNGEWNIDDENAKNNWLIKLHQNQKVYAFGGTDEHGNSSLVNYNVVRASSLTHANLENGLADGTSLVSNNGYITIEAKTNTQSSWTQMGQNLNAVKSEVLTLKVKHDVINSCKLKVYNSLIGSYFEYYYLYDLSSAPNELNITYPLSQIGNYYFRAECTDTSGDNRVYTNPIWVIVSSPPSCLCSPWVAGSCGGGSCGPSQRQYARSCNPSGCGVETMCVEEPSCLGGGGSDITVCQSGGCTYTSIQAAVSNSGVNDKIIVNDSATYNENIVMTASSSPWLECKKGAKIKGTNGKGIFLNHVDGPLIKGCYIEGFTQGIYVNSSYGLIRNNTLIDNNRGIYLEKEVVNDKILENTINDSGDYAIHFDATTWSNSALDNYIASNIIQGNGVKGIWLRYGLDNIIEKNNISTSGTGSDEMGIHLHSGGQTANHQVRQNTISENYYGVYVQGANGNKINDDIFCASNLNLDIEVFSSTGNSGDNNACEKPGNWNDVGATGCTYLCDTPPSVTLLSPIDNSTDDDGNVNFTCYSTDDSQLVNITLYHNISGTWQANQTVIISGITNTTTFIINNLENGTGFKWNCLAYDNRSRFSFASVNWTLSVIITNDLPTTPSNLLCNEALCTNNGTFLDAISVNCSGSTDPENDNITYSLEGHYNDSGFQDVIESFNNSLGAEDLTFIGNENKTRYLSIPKNANVNSAKLNLSSLPSLSKNNLVLYYNLNGATEIVSGIYNLTNNQGTAVYNNSNCLIGNCTQIVTNRNLRIPTNNFMNLSANTSISFWMRIINNTAPVSDEYTIIAPQSNAGGRIAISESSRWVWNAYFDPSNTQTNATAPQANTYYMITIVTKYFNSTNVNATAYVNGIIEGSGVTGVLNNANTQWVLGTAFNNNSDFINGQMDEFGVWNKSLNQSEISDLYNSGAGKTYSSIQNPFLEVGTPNGNYEWNYSGIFNHTDNRTSDFSSVLNSALNNGACDCIGCVLSQDECTIPFLFHSDASGSLEYSDIDILYNVSGMNMWRDIGNHSSSASLLWDIHNISQQSNVSLRCRAIDLLGSNTYSSYYAPSMNLTITRPPLDVRDLEVVYTNTTQRVFRFLINNTLTSALTGISWSLDTGNGNKTSQYNITLQGGENAIIIAYHNYTASGNYIVRASAQNSQYNDTEVISIVV